LLGGRQPGLDFAAGPIAAAGLAAGAASRPMREPRPHSASPEELIAHAALLRTIANPLWATEA
jgi:DNA polymerase III subunit epsilon